MKQPSNFEEFVQQEEELEKLRREQRREKEVRREAEEARRKADVEANQNAKKDKAERKERERAQKNRIMDEAAKRYAEASKKSYDQVGEPPAGEVDWLVFDRSTGELYGEARAWRAYEAWTMVNPRRATKMKTATGREIEIDEYVGFNQCRYVLREEWLAAEESLRKKRSNGKSNGAAASK